MSANSRQDRKAQKAQKQAKNRAILAQIAAGSPKEQESPGKAHGRAGKAIRAGKPGNPSPGNPGKQETRERLGERLGAKPLMRVASSRVRARIWVPIVLDTLKRIPNYTVAAESAGISRMAITERKNRDPKFAEQVERAITQGVEVLEAACWQRATMGWKRPIYGRAKDGEPVKVGEETLYSDRLAEVMLRAHAPEKYSPKIQQEISGPNGSSLAPVIAPTVIFNIPDNGRGLPAPKPIEISNGEPSPESPGEPAK